MIWLPLVYSTWHELSVGTEARVFRVLLLRIKGRVTHKEDRGAVPADFLHPSYIAMQTQGAGQTYSWDATGEVASP